MRRILATFISFLFAFGSFAQQTLGIDEALNIALLNNFNVLIAKNQAEMAANYNTLGNAGFLPRVDAGITPRMSTQNTNLKFFTGEEVTRDNAKSQSNSAFVELNWTVFDGFKMFATKNKLEELENLGQYEMLFRVEVVASQVMSMYFQIVQEQKFFEILNQTLAISNERVRLAETKLRIGSGSELQSLNAFVNRNADSSAVLQQKLRIKNIKADFNILLGRQPELDFGVSPEFIYLNDLNYNQLKQDISTQNKAVLMARSQVAVASSQIREAQSAFYPRIGLYGAYTYGTQQNEVGVISNTKNFGPALGASLTWNLFNGLNDKNEVKNRRIAFDNATQESNQTSNEVSANLYKAFNNYAVWRDLFKLESLNVDAAKEDVRIAKTNLDLGGLNDVEFRVIQLGALDAEYRLLFAEYQSRLAQIELLRLSGILAQTLNF